MHLKNFVVNILGLCIGIVILSACSTGTGYVSTSNNTVHNQSSSGAQTGSNSNYSNTVISSSDPYYTVREGDTLFSIAFAHHIDAEVLAYLNDLRTPYTIMKGQRLIMDPKIVNVNTCVVRKGETAYRISRRYGLNLNDLVKINHLDSKYTVIEGQTLIVSRKGRIRRIVDSNDRNTETSTVSSVYSPNKPKTIRTITDQDSSEVKNNIDEGEDVNNLSQSSRHGNVSWKWPAGGRIISHYSQGEHGKKGIDISGKRGSKVRAAAAGKVVYAGNALRGYGNLIIVSHNDDYLSAYANNQSIMVREGQSVQCGQQIASMGDSDAKSVRLHFEIRYHGQTVNPINYLPKKR